MRAEILQPTRFQVYTYSHIILYIYIFNYIYIYVLVWLVYIYGKAAPYEKWMISGQGSILDEPGEAESGAMVASQS